MYVGCQCILIVHPRSAICRWWRSRVDRKARRSSNRSRSAAGPSRCLSLQSLQVAETLEKNLATLGCSPDGNARHDSSEEKFAPDARDRRAASELGQTRPRPVPRRLWRRRLGIRGQARELFRGYWRSGFAYPSLGIWKLGIDNIHVGV